MDFFANDDVPLRTVQVFPQVLQLYSRTSRREIYQYWSPDFTYHGFPEYTQYEVVLGFIL